ncbi:hypothetical protein DFR68_101755 [Nocardia mexicana]|uniref:Uncharacterized protein n=1 Tax=Nocardia mexicana TaxID=279262 RepID=A0A370HFA2_9NOCA|nr:hypothetical protein DFR68_101755 [Nocardia mexicana]
MKPLCKYSYCARDQETCNNFFREPTGKIGKLL